MGPSDAGRLDRFAIPDVLAIVTDPGGLTHLAITNAHARGTLYLMGAQCTHFQPAGESPVLWMSAKSRFIEGAPIRGGIPICWPWFGPHPTRTDLGAHGFARTAIWQLARTAVAATGATEITLVLESSAATRAMWPHDFQLALDVSFGAALTVTLTIRNTGADAFTCDEALHTYLTVADVRTVDIRGLQGTNYIDKVQNQRQSRQDDPLAITGETDRIYLDATGPVDVVDPGLARTIRVEKSGSSATVVWNPWIAKAKAMSDFGDDEWPSMLCIEAANVGQHTLQLAAGTTHRTSTILRRLPSSTH